MTFQTKNLSSVAVYRKSPPDNDRALLIHAVDDSGLRSTWKHATPLNDKYVILVALLFIYFHAGQITTTLQ